MKRARPMRRKGALPRRGPRHDAEWVRAYGSPARVAWVSARPCVVCDATPCENAHTRTGGMGRRADAVYVAPLCPSCHQRLHAVGRATFEQTTGIALSLAAAYTARAWQTYTEEGT